MPRAPKQCAHPDCGERVVARTYCDQHTPTGWTSGGPSRTSTTQHRRWRRAVLERANHTCEIRDTGCTGRATEADHIVSVKLRPDLEFDINAGQATCHSCHKRKTQREARAARTRTSSKRQA